MYKAQEIRNAELPELIARVNDELRAIERAFTQTMQLQLSRRPPNKLRAGMLVYADGVGWDPGSGEGFYAYYNSQWNKLAIET